MLHGVQIVPSALPCVFRGLQGTAPGSTSRCPRWDTSGLVLAVDPAGSESTEYFLRSESWWDWWGGNTQIQFISWFEFDLAVSSWLAEITKTQDSVSLASIPSRKTAGPPQRANWQRYGSTETTLWLCGCRGSVGPGDSVLHCVAICCALLQYVAILQISRRVLSSLAGSCHVDGTLSAFAAWGHACVDVELATMSM